jgi:hypothetical protein
MCTSQGLRTRAYFRETNVIASRLCLLLPVLVGDIVIIRDVLTCSQLRVCTKWNTFLHCHCYIATCLQFREIVEECYSMHRHGRHTMPQTYSSIILIASAFGAYGLQLERHDCTFAKNLLFAGGVHMYILSTIIIAPNPRCIA